MPETPVADPPVRLRSVPRCDPPYDDERPADMWAATTAQPLLDLPPPAAGGRRFGPPAPVVAPEPVHRQVPQAAARAGGEPWLGPPAANSATTTAAVRFVNTCLEIFNGYRAVGHFRSLACPLSATNVVAEMTQALRRLRRSSGRAGHRGSPIKLRRMRTCQPQPGVAEIAVVIGVGSAGAANRAAAAWALAYRLEQRHGRWLCTAARML
jgi:hypothetical protein